MHTYEIFEQWMGGRNDALIELGRITTDTVESVARRNYDVAGDCFELGLSQLKAFGAGNDFAKLSAEETRLANDFGNRMKAHAEAYARIAAEAGEAYAAWTASLTDVARKTAEPKPAPKAAAKKR